LILWPTSDKPQFVRPVIVNRFPTSDINKKSSVGLKTLLQAHCYNLVS